MKEEKRKQRLEHLLTVIAGGKDVAVRDMKTVLTSGQFGEMQSDWESQQQQRQDIKNKPANVIEYEGLLREAQFLDNKRAGYGGSNRRARERLANKAEAAFERALQRLEEMAEQDPMLHIWFDRALDFDVTGDLAPSVGSMPLVVTTRSAEREGSGILNGLQTKRQVKQAALERALEALEVDPEEEKRNAEAAMEAAKVLRAALKRRR